MTAIEVIKFDGETFREDDVLLNLGMTCTTCRKILWWSEVEGGWGTLENWGGKAAIHPWSGKPRVHDHYPRPSLKGV